MASVYRNALVAFSTQQMFDLVNDVDSYSEFLPDCADSKIVAQHDDGMTAAVKIQKAGLSHWFTTRNVLSESNKITLSLVDGPFKNLTGEWRFTALSDCACKVELELDFEFSNRLISMAFGPIFSHIANNLVLAFGQRAKQVYSS